MASSLELPKFEPDRDRLVWYLAYGSNLSSQTFREDRQITPQAAVTITVPGWRLTLSSAGFPYREPSFASIVNVGSAGPTDEKHDGPCELPLHGTAYLITWSQWIKIVASEGGGIVYKEALLRGQPIQPQDQQRWGAELSVLTLVSTMERWPEPRPSQRYMVRIIFVPKLRLFAPVDGEVNFSSLFRVSFLTVPELQTFRPVTLPRFVTNIPVISLRLRRGNASVPPSFWGSGLRF
ncbi:unnamed protein product [Aspergillus oryzae]|uniref:Unnamed protein product n=2 Tax=Aspergillus oryzae TaxID=5062 RepID=A0AAN4YC84_ASPOZ|nr:unnamed protein product [Aspergillus oryzae]GMF95845.1 unnamed protein product [Aspergillus oryzae]GMG07377.1 unnamed protein product [Aspergillus oryzae]GMG23936.1 unnamed protein product [Aspergillus oryzae]GMG45923.1 unnamed protein product [Aspergillus oryzae var. brunneus]